MVRPLHELRDLRPARVCIIKPSALGDVVNALSALSALRAIWPEAKISWVINASLRGLLDGHPELDEVVVYDRARTSFSPRGLARFARFLGGLRGGEYDLAIDLQGLLRSGLMAAATRAPFRVGLADAREGATRFYTHRVTPPPPGSHAVDRLLKVAESFGADISSPRFTVAAGEAERGWARRALSGVASPCLMLNMGARWQTKRWPPEHFAEIARRAVAAFGAGLVAVGAPEDRPIVDAFRAHLGEIPLVDLCGRTTLPQLAALFAESDLVLSNDSGPLHLATAAGARVVGVYTCTSAALNGPYGPRATAVETQVWCAASYVTTCSRLECFTELTPDRVWDVVEAQLARSEPLESPAA
jgi:heptosyltransferase-1